MTAQAFPYHTTVEVVFRDLDPLGHVNNVVHFTWMETARTKFLTQLLSLDSPQSLPVILAEATCSYKSPAYFGEVLVIGVGVSRFGTKSFDMVYRIETEGGRLVATGKTVTVMYDYAARQSYPVPDDLKRRIREYQGEWQVP